MKEKRETIIKAVSVIMAAVMFAVAFLIYDIINREKSEDDIVRRAVTTTLADSSSAPEIIDTDSETAYPMDINKASAEQLTAVKGIGGITAGRIIDYRAANGKIRDIAELTRVDGIGDELCALIAEYFYVDEADYVAFTTSAKITEQKTSTTKETTAGTTLTTSAKTTAATAVTTQRASFPIDINNVTKDELMQIDGIGEGMADKIIALRDTKGKITDMEQLLEIYGIGNDRLNMLMSYLYVSDNDYSKASTTTITTTVTTAAKTTAARVTTQTKTSRTTTTTATSAPEQGEKTRVNINEADAREIADSLLIDIEAAEMIVWLRERIHGYSNILEVLYLEDFDKRYDEDFYNSIKDYIYV